MSKEKLIQVDELKSSTLISYADKVMTKVKSLHKDLTSKNASSKEIYDYNKIAKKSLSNRNKALDKAAKKTMVPSQARESAGELDIDKSIEGAFLMFEGVHRPGFVAIAVNHDMSPEGKKGNKYTVFFKPNKKSPRGHTKPVDISHHKDLEDAKKAKDAYVKKHAASGVVALRGMGEGLSFSSPPNPYFVQGKKGTGIGVVKKFKSKEAADDYHSKMPDKDKHETGKFSTFMDEDIEQVDEISQELKTRYKEKASAQMKELKPFTSKKSEYRDLAKNIIAKRKAGLAKVTEEVEQVDEAVKHETFDHYHKGAQSLLKKLSAALDTHKKNVHKTFKSQYSLKARDNLSSTDIYDIKNLHRQLQDLHDNYAQTAEHSGERIKSQAEGKVY